MKLLEMNVGRRLGLGFAALLLALIGVGVLGLLRLAQLDASVERMATLDWTKASLALEVNVLARDNARKTGELLLADPAEGEALRAAIGKNKAKITADLEQLATLLYLPEGKALLGEIKAKRALYVESFTQVLKLAGNGATKAEAVRIYRSETGPRLEAFMGKVDELVALQDRIFRQSADDGAALYRRARTASVAIIIATLLAGLAMAVLLARSITRPLTQAMHVAEGIRDGHLNQRIDARGTDEPARLLGALDGMQSALRERDVRDADFRGQIAAIGRAQAVVEFDLDCKITQANENFLNLMGYSLPELLGQPHRVLVDPGEREGADYRAFWDKLRRGEHESGRYRLIGKGGKEAWVQASYNPIVGADGTPCRFVTYATDVTQQVLLERRNEIGKQLHAAVVETRGAVQAAISGDLTSRIPMEGKGGEIGELCSGVNELLGATAELIRRVKASADEVRTGAEEISRGNANLSQRTEQQASSLEETASSMEEMTSTVRQTADNAEQANQLAEAARQKAEAGGAVVGSAVSAMGEISASSRKIEDIIGVIDEIAFQTNLLALNAAVEAARAGEQGRGFAVVASEVRNLAGRSAAAAKEIKALIHDSVTKVEEGSRLVDESGHTLDDIVAAVKKVTAIVAEIAAASREQSAGIEQVNKAVTQMDETTQQNAALVEQAAAASMAISQQAQSLAAIVAGYRVQAGGSEGSGRRSATVTPLEAGRRGAARP